MEEGRHTEHTIVYDTVWQVHAPPPQITIIREHAQDVIRQLCLEGVIKYKWYHRILGSDYISDGMTLQVRFIQYRTLGAYNVCRFIDVAHTKTQVDRVCIITPTRFVEADEDLTLNDSVRKLCYAVELKGKAVIIAKTKFETRLILLNAMAGLSHCKRSEIASKELASDIIAMNLQSNVVTGLINEQAYGATWTLCGKFSECKKAALPLHVVLREQRVHHLASMLFSTYATAVILGTSFYGTPSFMALLRGFTSRSFFYTDDDKPALMMCSMSEICISSYRITYKGCAMTATYGLSMTSAQMEMVTKDLSLYVDPKEDDDKQVDE